MPAERVPAHSEELEHAVLGAVLLDSTILARLTGLTVADFYRPDHRTIFAEMKALERRGVRFDALILSEELERNGKKIETGGLSYLAGLVRDTPGTANTETHAARLREYSLRRRLKTLATKIERESDAAGDADALLSRIQEHLLRLQNLARSGNGLISTHELAPEFIDDLENRRTAPAGLQTGITDFDALTHGLEPGDLVVIAARPGMGKTALLVTIAAHVAQSHSVAVFSAEMPARQLMRRCVSLLGNIAQGKLRRADKLTDADWDAITPAVAEIARRRLWIDETATPALNHIRSECFALKACSGLGLVMVDYVQLVHATGANRYDELRQVAYGLKAMAKDLAVPVIVLAQLNRGVKLFARASSSRHSGLIARRIIVALKSYRVPDHSGRRSPALYVVQ